MKKLFAIVCIALVLMLSGCSSVGFESTNIMCPPKATGNKAQIQKLIDKQTSGEYVLKYPKSGSNRSSIILHNFDDDETEEAIAFYSDKDGEHIHALFVEYIEDSYSVIEDILVEASGVDRIDFADLDGDGTYEILVGYSVSTSSQNVLSIYSYSESITQYDISCSYSSLVTGDFTYDKREDILLISLYSGDIAAKANLMIFNDNTLTELGSTELDSDITQLAQVSYGQISYGTYGAVLDGISTTGDYTTQVVLFDPSRPALLNPLYIYSGYSDTRRSTQICSLDYDKDELIDIPVCSLMMYDSTEDIQTVARHIRWSNMNTDNYSLSTSISTIFCSADGYLLTMPSKWSETATARYDSSLRELTVYACEYVENTLTLTDELVTIKAYSEDDFRKDSTGFIEFLRAGSTVYAYSIGNTENYLSITGDEISSLFRLVNQ